MGINIFINNLSKVMMLCIVLRILDVGALNVGLRVFVHNSVIDGQAWTDTNKAST
eukprot:Pgem_evm1s18516